MKKWYAWLIVVAVIVFVVCMIADILWIEKASAIMEIGTKETESPNAMRINGACFAVIMYGALGLGIVARRVEHGFEPKLKELTKDCPFSGLGAFLFILFFAGGMGTLGLLMALGFIG